MGHGQEEVIDVALATAVWTDTWLVIENLHWIGFSSMAGATLQSVIEASITSWCVSFWCGRGKDDLEGSVGRWEFFAQCWTLWTRKRELGSVCMIPEWLSFWNEFCSRVKFVLLSSDLARLVFASVKYVCATRARVYDLRFKIQNKVRFQFTKAMRSTKLVWLRFSWTSLTTLNLRNHCHHFTP